MVGAVAHWSAHNDLVATPQAEKRWLSLSLFPLMAMGYDKLFLVGQPGVSHGYAIGYEECASLADALDAWPSADLVVLVGDHPVGIEPEMLSTFEHPPGDTLYVVGADYWDQDWDALAARSDRVTYVTIEQELENHILWSHSCLAIALWDRYQKGG